MAEARGPSSQLDPPGVHRSEVRQAGLLLLKKSSNSCYRTTDQTPFEVEQLSPPPSLRPSITRVPRRNITKVFGCYPEASIRSENEISITEETLKCNVHLTRVARGRVLQIHGLEERNGPFPERIPMILWVLGWRVPFVGGG